MTVFDTVIRGGTVVTAGDRARCDVGICGGKVVALADRLSGGERTIDASQLVLDVRLFVQQTLSSHQELPDKSVD